MDTPPLPEYKVFSVGFRCSVAGILKQMGLKHESYPFDWLVSRLHVIQHCIETDFREFLCLENYVKKHTRTYAHKDTITEGYICDEEPFINHFYQPEDRRDEQNTYQYHLVIAHHNIMEENDYQYYMRCIDRFRNLLDSHQHKMSVYISPLLVENVEESICAEYRDCLQFYNFMFEKHKSVLSDSSSLSNSPPLYIGLFIILFQDKLENHPKLELMYEKFDESGGKCKIYTLRTNGGFLDGGETYMGIYHEEVDLIKSAILRFSDVTYVPYF